MLPLGRRHVLIFAPIGRGMLCAVYSWGRDEKIPRESFFFFFLVELEDSGAPAAPVLNEVWLLASWLHVGESVDLA